MEKSYVLRKQLNNRGCYAEIFFNCRHLSSSDRNLTITYNADSEWENSCKAGVEIFYDYFARKELGGLEVQIQEIKWMPVDTNQLIILFSMVQALSDALNFPIGGLLLDPTNETFIFPERRAL